MLKALAKAGFENRGKPVETYRRFLSIKTYRRLYGFWKHGQRKSGIFRLIALATPLPEGAIIVCFSPVAKQAMLIKQIAERA